MSRPSTCCSCRGKSFAVAHPRAMSSCARAGSSSRFQAELRWGTSTAQLNQLKTSSFSRCVAARAWGADIQFSPAKVVASEEEATGMKLVTVDVGKEISAGYTKGGQFIQMKVGDSKPAFLAISNAPAASKDGMFELLIKDVPDSTANLIVNLEAGSEVSVSPVMGKGFPVDQVPPEDFKTMFIFVTGSGISPIKALIDSGALDPTSRNNVTLFYGAKDTEHMAFLSKIPQWELLGVEVIPVFSALEEGYVQDFYRKREAPEDPAKTCALVCGQKEMAEAVFEILSAQGVSKDCCLTNF